MLGMSLLMALWAADSQNNLRAIDRLALRGTRVLVAVIAVVFAAFLALLAVADRLDDVDPRNRVIPAAAAVATIIIAAIALRSAARAQRLSNVRSAVTCIFGAYAGALCVAGVAAFPAIDR